MIVHWRRNSTRCIPTPLLPSTLLIYRRVWLCNTRLPAGCAIKYWYTNEGRASWRVSQDIEYLEISLSHEKKPNWKTWTINGPVASVKSSMEIIERPRPFLSLSLYLINCFVGNKMKTRDSRIDRIRKSERRTFVKRSIVTGFISFSFFFHFHSASSRGTPGLNTCSPLFFFFVLFFYHVYVCSSCTKQV